MTAIEEAVEVSNVLTQGWLANLDPETPQLASGVGVVVLLAALLEGATGEACAELEEALVVTKADAAATVNTLLTSLQSNDGMKAALGLWTHREVHVRPEYSKAIHATIDALPDDRTVLDRWIQRRTNGMIDRFPAEIYESTRFAAASVLAIEGAWIDPFTPTLGRWNGSEQWAEWLTRTTADLRCADLLKSEELIVSRVVCETIANFDVHLVAGAPTDSLDHVLRLAIDGLGNGVDVVSASDLKVGARGGCLRVTNEPSYHPSPQLRVSLPVFEINTTHNLLDLSGLFGLTSAQDPSRGHFPGISSYPLAIESASQAACAGFGATGFRAAAATASAAMGAAPDPDEEQKIVDVAFDRPFGFLVVDRPTGLVLFAGWT